MVWYTFFSPNLLRLTALFFSHFFKQTFLYSHFSSQTHPQRQWFNHFSLQKDLSRQYKFKIPKHKGMPSEPIWGCKIISLTSLKGFLSVHATKKWRHRKPPRKIPAIWMKQVVTCALYSAHLFLIGTREYPKSYYPLLTKPFILSWQGPKEDQYGPFY